MNTILSTACKGGTELCPRNLYSQKRTHNTGIVKLHWFLHGYRSVYKRLFYIPKVLHGSAAADLGDVVPVIIVPAGLLRKSRGQGPVLFKPRVIPESRFLPRRHQDSTGGSQLLPSLVQGSLGRPG